MLSKNVRVQRTQKAFLDTTKETKETNEFDTIKKVFKQFHST